MRGLICLKWMLKPCANSSTAFFFRLFSISLYSGFLREIRHQQRDQIGVGGGIDRRGDLEAVLLRLLPARATLAHANDDIGAAVLQVQRVRATLAAVAQNGDASALQCLLVDVFLAVKLHLKLLPSSYELHIRKKPRSGAGPVRGSVF